jgi:beta-N-acetylhexosaminidase
MTSSAPAAPSAADSAWADSVLRTMPLRDRAAQMVWPNLMGDYVPTDASSWRRLAADIQQDKVGGLLISIGSPIEIAAKLNALQRMSALPLLVGADLETGAGMRARGGYFVPNGIDLGSATLFPPEMALGATGDTALAYEAGRVTAVEGRALGIHLDFSPVLDVNNNPANPVINTRSYGEYPPAVARLGRSYIRGLQEHGMIATGKHFPGHGDTGTNSHLALPVVTVSRARLDSVELVPFRAAIAAGVGAIMTFHGSMPALDSSGVPGTLSPKVNTDLLRRQLGFHGLIVSDAMDMRGVLDTYGPTQSVQRAVASGVDVLIQPVDAHAAVDAIVQGVADGQYPESRVGEAARRILMLKHQLGLHRNRLVDLDSLRTIVGDSAHVAVAQTVADRSITVVRDSLHVLPLTARSSANAGSAPRVLAVTVANRTDLVAGTTFDAELRQAFPTLRSVYVMADGPAAEARYRQLDTLADSADVIIISSYVGQRWNVTTISAPQVFADWVARTAVRRSKVIVVAFGNPYLLQQIPDVPAYVVAWGSAPVSQRAAASALLGRIAVGGTLPISIPPTVSRGAGLTLTPARRISPSADRATH